MASFEQLYQMQMGQTNPLLNVQQLSADMPNWLRAPAPPSDNIPGTNLLLNQMNRVGDVQFREDKLEQERERARAMADIQMRSFLAKQAQNKQAQESREEYAAENPEFAGAIMAGERPSDFQRKMQMAGGDPERFRQLFGPAAATQINVGGEPSYKVPSNYMLRDPADPSKGVVPIPGGPGEKRAGETAGKEAMLDVAMSGVPIIKSMVFEEGDYDSDIRRDVLFEKAAAQMGVPGQMVPEGSRLASAMETGIQAITRIETGAAMAPTEIANTRKRFEPSPLDSDVVIRQKLKAYEMFLGNAKEYLDPSGAVDTDKALSDAAKELGIEDEIQGSQKSDAGITVDQNALDAELRRRGLQ